eukprot:Em0010g58a
MGTQVHRAAKTAGQVYIYGGANSRGSCDRTFEPVLHGNCRDTCERFSGGTRTDLLQHVQKNIDDLIASQEDMLQSVNEKKAYFQDQKEAADIAATIQLVPHYKNKLSSIIKQMQGINKRVTKLKQRALHLKELRTMKDEQSRKDYERQLNQVYQLAAKPPK